MSVLTLIIQFEPEFTSDGVKALSKRIKQDNITVIAIGVGTDNMTQINEIVSDANEEFDFTVPNTDALETVVNATFQQICPYKV